MRSSLISLTLCAALAACDKPFDPQNPSESGGSSITPGAVAGVGLATAAVFSVVAAVAIAKGVPNAAADSILN